MEKILWNSTTTINCLVTNILLNVLFCVQQTKEPHTCLEQIMTKLNIFGDNHPFKSSVTLPGICQHLGLWSQETACHWRLHTEQHSKNKTSLWSVHISVQYNASIYVTVRPLTWAPFAHARLNSTMNTVSEEMSASVDVYDDGVMTGSVQVSAEERKQPVTLRYNPYE